MRRIVTFNHLTADGYFAGTDGNLNWVVQDEEVQKIASAGMPDVDTILFGRRTYEVFEGFWPKALDDPSTASEPHQPGKRSKEAREMAVWLTETHKVVFSKTRKDVTWKNSRIVRELDPGEIDTMKRQPGKDMILFGSGSIVSQLTEHRLIDEYVFALSSILLGNGRDLITGLSKSARVDLLDVRKTPSGNVVLRYAATT
jgi:dihydrofolate reductase